MTMAWVPLFSIALATNPAAGQVQQGPWVDDNEQEVDRARKTNVAVIVLDQKNRAIQGAQVQLEQQRHDFVIGLTLPVNQQVPQSPDQKPVYRIFNALSFERYTDWASMADGIDAKQEKLIKDWVDAVKPISTNYGRVVSDDPAHNLDQLSLYNPLQLRDAVLARIENACRFTPAPDTYDLYADIIGQDMIERKIGRGLVHRMFEMARAKSPHAKLNLRIYDAISLQRGRDLIDLMQRMEVLQIPFDGVTLEQRFGGQVQPIPLNRMLRDYVEKVPVPVTITGLEVGGPSEVAAGLNIETVIRLLFAQPNVAGIYFSGLTPAHTLEENGELLNRNGEPSAAGSTLDALFSNHWHSSVTGTTDERGNIQARVFTGWYKVDATLPSGATMTVDAYIPRSDRTKLIVLQTTAAESTPQGQ